MKEGRGSKRKKEKWKDEKMWLSASLTQHVPLLEAQVNVRWSVSVNPVRSGGAMGGGWLMIVAHSRLSGWPVGSAASAKRVKSRCRSQSLMF